MGRALFGLQGLSSQGSIFSESAIGIDVDEVQFLEETLWDKIKLVKERLSLSSVAEGLLGISLLRSPVAGKIRNFLYSQVQVGSREEDTLDPIDVVTAVRGLKLNALAVPQWLAEKYLDVEEMHMKRPVVMQSRSDKLIVQRFKTRDTKETLLANSLVDGFSVSISDFPDIKLNVELDGPTHKYPARARYDRSRDEFLIEN